MPIGRLIINQIANVGFIDVDRDAVLNAISQDTLFIHGSAKSGGSQKFLGTEVPDKKLDDGATADQNGITKTEGVLCMPACGVDKASPSGEEDRLPGISQACDRTCLPGKQGVRFDGHLCGAGNASVYGEACRTCFTDEVKAIKEDKRLRLEEDEQREERGDDGKDDEEKEDFLGKHVIMCDTMRPPTALGCSAKCNIKVDTVSLNLLILLACRVLHLHQFIFLASPSTSESSVTFPFFHL